MENGENLLSVCVLLLLITQVSFLSILHPSDFHAARLF